MQKKSRKVSSTRKKNTQKQIYLELIRKSIAASLMIGLGVYVLLKLGNPLGPILFALGLLCVCVMGDLTLILIVNLIAGWLFGLLFSASDSSIISVAQEKVASWNFDWSFFIRSIMCGVIMYLAVATYRKGTKLGILFGVPLFIFCGFQHCIANIITLGVAQTLSWTIVPCILGNFIGSIVTWWLCRSKN